MTDTARELLVKLAQDAVANQHILRTAIMRTSRPSLTAAIGRLLRPGSPSQ